MTKPHDEAFESCMEHWKIPAELVGAAVGVRVGGMAGAVSGVGVEHGVMEFGEAVCDGTLTGGPPASYFEAKVGYPPQVEWDVHDDTAKLDASAIDHRDAHTQFCHASLMDSAVESTALHDPWAHGLLSDQDPFSAHGPFDTPPDAQTHADLGDIGHASNGWSNSISRDGAGFCTNDAHGGYDNYDSNGSYDSSGSHDTSSEAGSI